jgi:outer membrane protein assembly factor BamB
VDIKEEPPAPRTPGSPMRILRTLVVEIVGPVIPLLVDVSVAYDAQQYLVAQDGLGERRFRIPLFEQGGRRAPNVNRNAYNAPALSYAGVNGGLMVLLLGNQVLAVDTMRLGETAANRVLWTEELNDNPGGYPTSQGVLTRPVNLAWGGVRFVPEDAFGRRLGSMGPVNDDGIAFQRLHDLTCVDPLTGKAIWTRRSVGLGNDLFGDEELLFVAPPGDSDCLVLNAATGQQLGTRRVAPLERRVVTIGRSVLSWEPQNQLAMRDAWLSSTLWTHPFAPGSKAALVGHEAVGVLQPDGAFTLLALPDGKPLVEQKLEAEASLSSIFLMRTTEGYLLVTNGAARGEPHVAVQPIPAAPNNIVSGRMYAFARQTGKPLWPKPVTLSQQGLLLSQPRSLPAFVFARQIHTTSPVNQREAKMSVLCIDKRSGRVLYQNDQLPGSTIASFEIAGDPVAHTVTVSLPSQNIKLSFTNEPMAPGGEVEGVPKASATAQPTEKAD